jgi:SH3 domain-containing YSC84-like protein 1
MNRASGFIWSMGRIRSAAITRSMAIIRSVAITRSMAMVACLAATACLNSPSAAADQVISLNERITESTAVYQELLASPDRGVPTELLEKCRCIAVIPGFVNTAFVYGGQLGLGVMSCRNAEGKWSPPTFVGITGGSWLKEIGESSDLVLFFMNEEGAKAVLTTKRLTLGRTATVAAGPFGKSGKASPDLKLDSDIYTYARVKGVLAGIPLTGSRMAPDEKGNAKYYGQPATAQELLFDQKAPTVPEEAEAFRKALP